MNIQSEAEQRGRRTVDALWLDRPGDLRRIAVPTTLIWGRDDVGVRLNVAEAAGVRYGGPLHVIENARDDPAIEQPEAFLEALDAALDDYS